MLFIKIYHGQSTNLAHHTNLAQNINVYAYEKVSIFCAYPNTLSNKRTELISKCRHRIKFFLANAK